MEKKDIDAFIKNLKSNFNRFERNIDRKYALYRTFMYADESSSYNIKKYIGSNQVILKYKDETVYNSDDEKPEQRTPEVFESMLRVLIEDYIKENRK